MTNTRMFWAICLSLDAPLLHATPLGPARCWPHTSHLPGVADNEDVVDGGQCLGSNSGGEARGVFECPLLFRATSRKPKYQTPDLSSQLPTKPWAVPVQTCALSPASLLTDSLSYEGVFL